MSFLKIDMLSVHGVHVAAQGSQYLSTDLDQPRWGDEWRVNGLFISHVDGKKHVRAGFGQDRSPTNFSLAFPGNQNTPLNTMGIQNLQKACQMFSVAKGHSMAPIPRWSSRIIPVDHDAKVNHHHFLVGFHFNFSIVNMGDSHGDSRDSHIFKAGPYGISRIIRSSAASAVARSFEERHRGGSRLRPKTRAGLVRDPLQSCLDMPLGCQLVI